MCSASVSWPVKPGCDLWCTEETWSHFLVDVCTFGCLCMYVHKVWSCTTHTHKHSCSQACYHLNSSPVVALQGISISIMLSEEINTIRVNREIKTGLSSLTHFNAISVHAHMLADTQTQAKDALIHCMVKKYIYWNLCQCRKKWKLAWGFVTVPQVNIPAAARQTDAKSASSFRAVHLLLMTNREVGLWGPLIPNTLSHRHWKAQAVPRTHH